MMHHSIGKVKGNMSFPTQWGTILERVMLNKFLKGNSVKVLNSLFYFFIFPNHINDL